jgi:hypothetical protein
MNAAIPDRRPLTEKIFGVIERVTFHNEDRGFCVLRVKTKRHRGGNRGRWWEGRAGLARIGLAATE